MSLLLFLVLILAVDYNPLAVLLLCLREVSPLSPAQTVS